MTSANTPRKSGHRSLRRLVALSAIAAVAAFAAGCSDGNGEGGADDEAAVREAITAHIQSAIDGDAAAYCASLTEEVRVNISAQVPEEGDEDRDPLALCEQVMGQLFEAGMSDSTQQVPVTQVNVTGDSASVQTDSGANFTLVRGEDGAWLLSDGSPGGGDSPEGSDEESPDPVQP